MAFLVCQMLTLVADHKSVETLHLICLLHCLVFDTLSRVGYLFADGTSLNWAQPKL